MTNQHPQTRELILEKATTMFARNGYGGFSMRKLAKDVGIAPSVLYYYFPEKDQILEEMFLVLSKRLGQERAVLPQTNTASGMLYQRIAFQFDHAEAVVAVLKYYLHFRDRFAKHTSGFIPEKAYLHIEEVIAFGQSTAEISVNNPQQVSKIIAHAINGFLLEYYPYKVMDEEKDDLVAAIHAFIFSALTNMNSTFERR